MLDNIVVEQMETYTVANLPDSRPEPKYFGECPGVEAVVGMEVVSR